MQHDPVWGRTLGAWFRDGNANNKWDSADQAAIVYYGWKGATPVPGDWNGDGMDDVGVYNLGAWFRDMNGNNKWDGPNELAYFGWCGALPVVGNWASPAHPLLAVGGQTVASPATPTLTRASLQPIVIEAIARWAAAGVSAPALDAMKRAEFIVTDLPGSQLGLAQGSRIDLDRDAAGHGWFIDPTPQQDEEFALVRASKLPVQVLSSRRQCVVPFAVECVTCEP